MLQAGKASLDRVTAVCGRELWNSLWTFQLFSSFLGFDVGYIRFSFNKEPGILYSRVQTIAYKTKALF